MAQKTVVQKRQSLSVACLLGLIACLLFSCSGEVVTDPTERIGAVAESVDGKMFLIGGMTLRENLSSVYAFDSATSKWTPCAPMPTARATAASAVCGGAIYVIGGRNGNLVLGTVERYDPATNAWTSCAETLVPRWSHMAVAANGKVYVFGGISGIGDNRRALDKVEVYDPQTDAWKELASMPEARHSAGAVASGNRIFIISGKTAAYVQAAEQPTTDRVDCYDTASDTWSAVTQIPQGRTGLKAVVQGELIYVVGGIARDGEFPTTTDVYDPAADTWNAGPAFEKGRSGHCCVAVGDSIYVMGGSGVRYGSGTTTILKYMERIAVK